MWLILSWGRIKLEKIAFCLNRTSKVIKMVIELNASGSSFFIFASACSVRENKGNLSVQ